MAGDCCLLLPSMPRKGDFLTCPICQTVWERTIILGEERWERRRVRR